MAALNQFLKNPEMVKMTKFDDYLNKIKVNRKELTQEAIDTLYLGFIKLHELNGVDPHE